MKQGDSSTVFLPENIDKRVAFIIDTLKDNADTLGMPLMSSLRSMFGHDPFLVLVSCILSLRTKDTVTLPASKRLFGHALSPQGIIDLGPDKIAQLIYPVGFYKTKAVTLVAISQQLITHFGGKVPEDRDALLALPGVGPKTANLVLAEGFNIPAICVDTHVHRISNRLGIIQTNTPEETEAALMRILPQKYWISWNRWLVLWGQNICVPVVPRCSICPLASACLQVGVTRKR